MKEDQFLQPQQDPESLRETAELPFHPDDIENSDEMRVHLAKELGLPEDTPREEVREADEKQYISKLAHLLGLPEGSTHGDILAEEKRRGVNNLAYYLYLGMSEDSARKLVEDSSKEEFEEAYSRFLAKRRAVLEKVAEDMIVNRAKNVTPKNPKRLSE